ncbi:hypothetical protein [uncultured Bacteroides sp.]|uniref:hypothetical protein n=1 Tax=uncultured Bacteroides sp. TaxID=162156 RepID=UPI002626C036|nr:hypothetical protein [uncultured Bacteroides sp.]
MIKQDYIIRMIQEIISLIANAIIKKRKLDKKEFDTYEYTTHEMLGVSPKELTDMSTDELISQYSGSENGMEKLELIAVSLLLFSEETPESELLLKSRLKQDGIFLLKYLQKNSGTYSLQREFIINMVS